MNADQQETGTPRPTGRDRQRIPQRYRWRLEDIFADWDGWAAACAELERLIEGFSRLQGTLSEGPNALLAALELNDELGKLSYKVFYYPTLTHDEDQRDNTTDERRQRAAILLARSGQASAWFNPELLRLSLATVLGWMDSSPALALYRFALEEVFRQEEHVLDEAGERLLSLSSRFQSGPADAYSALTTADAKHPQIELSSGEVVTVTYGRYRAILAESPNQADRASAFESLYTMYRQTLNTYASLYSAIAERDWFVAQARSYSSTLEAALHDDNVPTEVVENLIQTTRNGVAPLRRYHRLRKQRLGLDRYHLYDSAVPLVTLDRKYFYDDVTQHVLASVKPLGDEYQTTMRRAFDKRWIDVYENEGKRSGAYSAPVYGVHPYMLLNYNDTLEDVFTLAHEVGHSIHTVLSHQHQPFVYAGYKIFVAEVASTLNEGLLLEHLLSRTEDPRERAVLLQRSVDAICSTFYTQVLFADWELQAHRRVEKGEPLTADGLSSLYLSLLEQYYGDVAEVDELYAITWARIPHFFRSPFYVYQYATCFASSALLLQRFLHGSESEREQTVRRYLELLGSGGSNHPMALLQRAGVDLGDVDCVQAVVDQLDGLVTRLETELDRF